MNETDSSNADVRVAFVSSLPHSGSTILDLTLSSHPRLVGLGEIGYFFGIRRKQPEILDDWPCTCGEQYLDCPFWSRVEEKYRADEPADDVASYRGLLEVFGEVFGRETILVDSSKNRRHLSDLCKVTSDVRVISLIRDVRSWVVSRRRLEKSLSVMKMARQDGLKGLDRRLRLTAPWLMIQWYRTNRAIDHNHESLQCDTLRVGYEEFATTTEKVLSSIWSFLDVADDKGHQENALTTHILFGNQMRSDKSLRSGVFYDTRWMSDRAWNLGATVLLPIMNYNAAQVYSGGQILPFGLRKELHSLNQVQNNA